MLNHLPPPLLESDLGVIEFDSIARTTISITGPGSQSSSSIIARQGKQKTKNHHTVFKKKNLSNNFPNAKMGNHQSFIPTV
jgi:hypothetical protein